MLDALGLIRERLTQKGIKNLRGIHAKILAHMYTVLSTCRLLPSLFLTMALKEAGTDPHWTNEDSEMEEVK